MIRTRLALPLAMAIAISWVGWWVLCESGAPTAAHKSSFVEEAISSNVQVARTSTRDPLEVEVGAPARSEEAPPLRRLSANTLLVRARLANAALPGATVYALPWTTKTRALAERTVGLPDHVLRSATMALTARDGTAAFDVKTSGPVLVVGRGPGSAPAGRLVTDTSTPLVLDLPREQIVRGSTWNWPEQTPLHGATVLARRAFQAEAVLNDTFDPFDRVAGMFFSSETTSNESGLYSLGGLPAGRVLVIASAPNRASIYAHDRILPTDNSIPLSLVPGSRIQGVVIDAESGLPLEGVRVATISKGAGFTQWESDLEFTKSDGFFDLSAPLEEGSKPGIRASLDGYADATQLLPNDSAAELTLELRKAASAQVRTVETDGQPVSARVQAYAHGSDLFLTVVRTNANGLANLSLDCAGHYSLIVMSEEHEERILRDIEFRDGPVEIVLDRLSEISGIVTSAGAPVARAVVRARREQGDGRWTSDDRVAAGADGTFTIHGLVKGDYVLDAWPPDDAPGLAHGRIELHVGLATSNAVSITLPASVTVSGTVRSEDTGLPIAGATISLADEFRFGVVSGGLPGGVASDEHGRFTLGGLPPDRPRLYVEHDAYVAVVRDVNVTSDVGGIDIRLHRPAQLEVLLPRFEQDRPTLFAIKLSTDSGRTEQLQSRSASITFDRLPPGAVSIVTYPLDGTWNGRPVQRAFSARVELRSGEHRRIELNASGGAMVRGRVELPAKSGLDFNDLVVVAHPAGHSPLSGLNGARVLSDGRFEFPMAPIGDVIVRLHGNGDDHGASVSDSVRLTLLEGEERELVFRPSICGMNGRVTNASGQGIRASLRVRSRGIPPGPWATFKTDEDGRFRHIRAPGTVEWTAGAEGYGTVVGMTTISDASSWVSTRAVLRPEATLLVQVEDLAGEAVLEARPNVAPADLADADDAIRMADWGAGRWYIRRLGPGPHLLEVSADGYLPYSENFTFMPGRELRTTVVLRKLVELEFAAVRDRGKPMDEELVTFRLLGADQTSTWEGTTDAEGRLIAHLPEGPYEVVILHQRVQLDLTGKSGRVRVEYRLD